MSYLPDTHLLIWSAAQDTRLPADADAILNDPSNEIFFSAASLWEIAIKARLGRPDFQVDPFALTAGLIAHGYIQLPIRSRHALAVYNLPALHKDPFDRLLIAQAMEENLILLTVDAKVAQYPGPIQKL